VILSSALKATLAAPAPVLLVALTMAVVEVV